MDKEPVDFRGVFPAIVTPMKPDGEVNEEAYRQIIEFNLRSGVDGFWIAGGSGESVLLTDEENMRLASVSVDQVNGRGTNIMHVGAASTARSAKLAEHAARAGVDAICAIPPFFYRPSDEELVEYYRVIADAADLPLFVYNVPPCTGVEITPARIKKIQEHVPQLVGLKHSGLSFEDTRIFTEMGLKVLMGQGKLMLPALIIGASGGVDGPQCVAPELWVDIWNAYNLGDLGKAKDSQRKAAEFLDLTLRYAYHSSLKAVLSERIGIDCGSARPPLGQLTAKQRRVVVEEAAELGLNRV